MTPNARSHLILLVLVVSLAALAMTAPVVAQQATPAQQQAPAQEPAPEPPDVDVDVPEVDVDVPEVDVDVPEVDIEPALPEGDLETTRTRTTTWYADPVWVIGGIVLIGIIILLIVLAGRGGPRGGDRTTVIKD